MCCLRGSPGSTQEHLGCWNTERGLGKSKLWAGYRPGPSINSWLWEQGREKAGEGSPGSPPWWGRKWGRSLGEEVSYREVSLVDPQEEDELGQAQGRCEVSSDAVLVGAQGTKKGEEEEGDHQGS